MLEILVTKDKHTCTIQITMDFTSSLLQWNKGFSVSTHQVFLTLSSINELITSALVRFFFLKK